jgi:hypothetical protein
MRIDIARGLKIGDIVYNCFLDQLVITSRYDQFVDNKTNLSIILSTVNTRLYKETYSSDDLYLTDFQDESDEEIAWVHWAKDNRDLLTEDEYSFKILKECFKQGFSKGFEHKKKISAHEMLQK